MPRAAVHAGALCGTVMVDRHLGRVVGSLGVNAGYCAREAITWSNDVLNRVPPMPRTRKNKQSWVFKQRALDSDANKPPE